MKVYKDAFIVISERGSLSVALVDAQPKFHIIFQPPAIKFDMISLIIPANSINQCPHRWPGKFIPATRGTINLIGRYIDPCFEWDDGISKVG